MTFYRRDDRPRHVVSNNMAVLNMLKEAQKRFNQQRARARYDDMHYWFKAYPSCPPDTVIHVRGGLMYANPADSGVGEGWWLDPEDGDFGPGSGSLDDGGGGGGGAPAFTNANYYRGFILCTAGNVPSQASPTGLFFYYTTDEYATAVEAQTAVWDIMFSSGPYFLEFPIALLILRNNGTTGSSGQILAIDAINRGGSYLWQDVRPRYTINQPT